MYIVRVSKLEARTGISLTDLSLHGHQRCFEAARKSSVHRAWLSIEDPSKSIAWVGFFLLQLMLQLTTLRPQAGYHLSLGSTDSSVQTSPSPPSGVNMTKSRGNPYGCCCCKSELVS